ncbi:MAG: GDP-L-fucose synthase family protein [Chloroflexota bacterium]
MDKNAAIYIADDEGLVGNALRCELQREGYTRLLSGTGGPRLTDSTEVDAFFARTRPAYVFLIGGKTGGIKANQNYPATLMRDNLLVNCHVIESARRYHVQKLLYLGSSCVYPKFSQQPMKVEYLTTGKLEPTNEPYALAKLAGLFLCQAYRQQFGSRFITAIPANFFGPGDSFDLDDAHVVGALLRRLHEAKIREEKYVEIWGSGLPRREFIFSEDLARACLFLMDAYDAAEPLNIGVGYDWSIKEIAEMIREVVGYSGELRFDRTKPDGMPAKLLDSEVLKHMGWQPRTSIREALALTYEWFRQHELRVEGTGDARAVL